MASCMSGFYSLLFIYKYLKEKWDEERELRSQLLTGKRNWLTDFVSNSLLPFPILPSDEGLSTVIYRFNWPIPSFLASFSGLTRMSRIKEYLRNDDVNGLLFQYDDRSKSLGCSRPSSEVVIIWVLPCLSSYGTRKLMMVILEEKREIGNWLSW